MFFRKKSNNGNVNISKQGNSKKGRSKCIVVTHKVGNREELVSFIKGYLISVAEIPVFHDQPTTDDTFREFLAGFYVGVTQKA